MSSRCEVFYGDDWRADCERCGWPLARHVRRIQGAADGVYWVIDGDVTKNPRLVEYERDAMDLLETRPVLSDD